MSSVRGRLTIRLFGFGVGFLPKQMVLTTEAMWKSLAPSRGLLWYKLTTVPVPRLFSEIFLLYSKKLVLVFQ